MVIWPMKKEQAVYQKQLVHTMDLIKKIKNLQEIIFLATEDVFSAQVLVRFV